MQESVALSIHGFIIIFCFYTFTCMIVLNYLFRELYCIIINLVFLLSYVSYMSLWLRWSGHPIPRIDINEFRIDWLIDWFIKITRKEEPGNLIREPRQATMTLTLRWLDGVFQGQYLPSLSVNYVAINKDMEKFPYNCIR